MLTHRNVLSLINVGVVRQSIATHSTERIQSLEKLDRFSEQDVREEIITPLLRAIGYRKESMFSVDREVSLRIAKKGLAVDYSVTLWEENFWIIEAKKPDVTKGVFGYNALWQAVQYAIHPKINAALVVLCDGHALEIYDREESLESPVLRVMRENLLKDLDLIRALLGPLQAWFFEKRRVVRLLDKVFDREFSLGRFEEMAKLLRRRLDSKRDRIIDNMRALPDGDTPEKVDVALRSLETPELIESRFWLEMPWRQMKTIASTLVSRSRDDAIAISSRIFPDRPRSANHAFHIHSLQYLITLHADGGEARHLPAWLFRDSSKPDLEEAINDLIGLCLTNFSANRDRQVILLHAAASRRVAKLLFVLVPHLRKTGQALHLAQRHFGDEFAFGQLVSSPERHLIFETERIERMSNERFVDAMMDEKQRFRSASARDELKRLWRSEITLLDSVDNYRELLRERDLGETFPTETAAVRYDQLGHGCLCMLDEFETWKAHAIANYADEIETLARLGSWQARQWIGMPRDEPVQVTEQEYATRFFLNDSEISEQLGRSYQGF